jgi:hypothetical protein
MLAAGTAGTLLVGGDMLVSSCVHDDSTVFIRDVLAPATVSAGQACTYTADPTQPTITAGVLDVALSSAYQAVFLVGNQMVPLGDPTKPVTETARVRVEGGIVRITDVNNKTLFSYTSNTSGTIDPQSGTTPGFAAISLQILNSATVQGVAPTGGASTVRLVSNVRIFGHTLGGQYVESDEFPFPVDICFGCLIAFTAADQNPNLPTPNCAGAAGMTSTMSSLPFPCVRGQDQPIDCALCQGIPACSGAVPLGTVIPVDAGPG